MTHHRTGSRSRTALAALLAAGITLTAAACGSSSDGKATSSADGVVTITVNDEPPATDPVHRKNFLADVAEFEKLHPKIKIVPHEGQMDPQTFSAKLAGGQLENVFYVYFTDPAGLIAKHQAADVTPYLDGFPQIKQVKPELLKVFQDTQGHTYGLPEGNYSMGLVYNRKLFTQAGLDPDNPPTTWDQVRTDAQKIAALGHGIAGYGDYSKSNTGGWHFTAEMYSRGGDVAKQDAGGRWTADFDNATGRAVLQQLHDMRWTDNSMGQRQLLEWADLLQMMGAGKLGMYVATSDNIPTIVGQYKGVATDFGLGPIPGGQGTLAGGGGFMFNPKDTPEQIKAGLAWLTFKYDNPDRIALGVQRDAQAKLPVGLPEPNLWTGTAAQTRADAVKANANLPAANYQKFVDASATIPLHLEPPNAQQIYAVLDTVMAQILTNKDADIDTLLSTATTQVNSILATVK
ncbi:ABC transporter substrate-binding protein [Streptacidiphilus monticola]|uniref:ABC transporter substrate-binding protein n=1 Tax=Streptacidiphilus monticola TaxID=2161674 RepID=A0ABW1G868_9ACTN